MVLPSRPVSQTHPEETVLHAAAQEFQKIGKPEVSKLKGGKTSLAGQSFQTWLKTLQLVKYFTAKHAWDKVEFYMGMVAEEDQSFEGLMECLDDAF